MDWTATRPKIEIAAEWIAAVMLGGAVAFALVMLAPAGMVAAGCGGAGAAAAAIAVQRGLAPGGSRRAPGFELVDWPDAADDGDDVLLLDEPMPSGGESRVVRLFGESPGAGDAAAIPAPGEMLARIESFLGANRDGALATGPVAAPRANAASAEASAALHAALADIRRSLRQG